MAMCGPQPGLNTIGLSNGNWRGLERQRRISLPNQPSFDPVLVEFPLYAHGFVENYVQFRRAVVDCLTSGTHDFLNPRFTERAQDDLDMQRSRLSRFSQRQSQSPDVSRRPGYQAKRLRPFSHHIKHRRAQNEEVRIRDRAPIFKGLRCGLWSRRDATIYPHRMARHEFRRGKKGTSLRYIVHKNEASAGEA